MPNSDLARFVLAASAGTNTELWTSLLSSVMKRWQITSSISATDADTLPAGHPDELRRVLAQRLATTTSEGTASSLLVPPKTQSETTIEALVATDQARVFRERAHAGHKASVGNHQSKYLEEWQQRVKVHAERPHEEMLVSLWDSGLSWRDIARLLRVSIASVQKWRAGEKMSSKNFARLRDFVAAYDTVAAHKPGIDLASWLDVPILTDTPITPLDLWTKGDPKTFFEYALGDLKPEAALDASEPDWRTRYLEDGFVTLRGADGNLSIGYKNR
jgi:DNA-binding transcriptional regulator YiaG